MKFSTLLRKAGFKKMSKADSGGGNCYTHKEHGWFAEIIDHETWEFVFLAGGKGTENFRYGTCNFHEVDELAEFFKKQGVSNV